MNLRRLGHSGLFVSPIALGGMTFGEANAQSFMHQVGSDEATAHAVLDRALDLGINLIDVADVYGEDGLSERVLGRWLQSRGRRSEVVLATKFRFRMGPGPNGTGASRRRVMAAVEASLQRLRTECIDLYQIHMQDLETPEEETLRALEDLVRQGKVLYLGASNYAAYRLMDSLWTSRSHGWSRFISLQMQYSLVHRELDREHLPLCQHQGLGLIPWSPLASGFLTGKYHEGETPPEGARLTHWRDRRAAYDNPRNWRIIAAVRQVAAELGATPGQVSLAWVLGRPAVSAVIVGARTVAQLEENAGAAGLSLSPAQVARLDEASALELGYPYDFMKRIQGAW